MKPFIANDGREIPLKAVGRRYVQMVMDKHPVPPVPTYEAKTVAGEVEIHQHKVKYDDKGKLVGTTLNTDEEWAMWHAYEEARTQAVANRMEGAIQFLMCECVDLQPAPLEEWEFDFASWGLEPPDIEDEREFKAYWIENELLPDSDDMARLVSRLYVIGGIVGEDQAASLEQFFRLTVARLSAS
jgi:YD repeat-containing protein